MTGALSIIVVVCASVAGETECRMQEVQTDLFSMSECQEEAEATQNLALNIAILRSVWHGVHVESVDAVCGGTGV